MNPLEPLEDDLRELLDAERIADAPTETDARRVFAAVGETIGLPLLGGGGSQGSAAGDPRAPAGPPVEVLAARLAKMIGIAVISALGGGIIGARIQAEHDRREHTPVNTASVTSPSQSSATPLPMVEVATASKQVTAPQVTTASASVNPSVPNTSADDALKMERSMLQMARVAILKGETQSALATLRAHETKFPHGRLSEERDALRIQALARSGNQAEAIARAERFRKAHPGSLMTPAIEAATGKLERDAGAIP